MRKLKLIPSSHTRTQAEFKFLLAISGSQGGHSLVFLILTTILAAPQTLGTFLFAPHAIWVHKLSQEFTCFSFQSFKWKRHILALFFFLENYCKMETKFENKTKLKKINPQNKQYIPYNHYILNVDSSSISGVWLPPYNAKTTEVRVLFPYSHWLSPTHKSKYCPWNWVFIWRLFFVFFKRKKENYEITS